MRVYIYIYIYIYTADAHRVVGRQLLPPADAVRDAPGVLEVLVGGPGRAVLPVVPVRHAVEAAGVLIM